MRVVAGSGVYHDSVGRVVAGLPMLFLREYDIGVGFNGLTC